MELQGKRVTVAGMGRSGLAACRLLLEKGAEVSITDARDNAQARENVRLLGSSISRVELGRHTEDFVDGQDLIVVSPGVSQEALPIVRAQRRGIPVISEIELAFAFCPAEIIAVTGTNGKTTVSTLIGQIFNCCARKAVVCGNIGNPFSGELDSLCPEDIVVLEVSSFQLETINRFRPRAAVMLNLTIDHLDRYASMEDYLAAKCRLFLNQTSRDWAVLNEDDPYSRAFAQKTTAEVVYFSPARFKEDKFRDLNSNHFAALTVAGLFGLDETEAIATCRRFKGIEHRLEQVACFQEVQFINDSKATNVDSTFWALDSIKKPVILIAGGRDKGSDFSLIRERARDRVRAAVLFGEAGEKINAALSGLICTEFAGTLSQAVERAFSLARAGDCVLLSPMCASFDMFDDYKHRGRVFKEAVDDLLNHNGQK